MAGYPVCGKRLEAIRKSVMRLRGKTLMPIGAEAFAALLPRTSQNIEDISDENPGMSKKQYRRYETAENEIPHDMIDSLRVVLKRRWIMSGFSEPSAEEIRAFDVVLSGLRNPDLAQVEWEAALRTLEPSYTVIEAADGTVRIGRRLHALLQHRVRSLPAGISPLGERELEERFRLVEEIAPSDQRQQGFLHNLDLETLRLLARTGPVEPWGAVEEPPANAKPSRKRRRDRGLFERPKGSNVWWIRYADHNGDERREKVGTKSDASDLYRERKAQVRRIKKGLEPAPEDAPPKGMKFKDFVRSCYPELSGYATWPNMKRMAEMWVKGFGNRTLTQVARIANESAIKRREVLREKNKSASTCNPETKFLKALLNRAVKQGLLDKNPMEHLDLLPEKNKRTRIMRGNEEELLKSVMSPEQFEVVEVAVQTGIRRGKLLSLGWAHIDFADGGWITVSGAKADSDRQVPMTNRVREILERRYACRGKCLWVFPNKSGKNHVNANNWYNRVWKTALEKAGIDGLTIHDLRRTFASRMSMKGQGGRQLSGILGHKSSKTTDRYAHLDPEAFRAAIQVLNEPDQSKGLRVIK